MFGGGQQQQNAQAMAIPTGISEIDQNESKISSISSLPNRSYSNHAEKRANHNAVERQRRETLNNRFLELAQCIPSLAHVRKPTKSVIVSRSIEFMHDSKLRLESNSNLIKGLKAQNEELKTELNRLRNELGRPPMHFTDPVEEERIAFQTRVQNSNFVRNSQPVYASSLRNGSPFEIANGDDDEDYESTPGSFVQKGNLDIRSPAAQFFTNTHTQVLPQGQSLLGHALQEMKPILVPSFHPFQNQAPTPQPTPPPFQSQARIGDQMQENFYDFSGQISRPEHRRAVNVPISQSLPASQLDFSGRLELESTQSPFQQNGFPIPQSQHFFPQSYMQ